MALTMAGCATLGAVILVAAGRKAAEAPGVEGVGVPLEAATTA